MGAYLVLIWMLFIAGRFLFALPYMCMGPVSMLKPDGTELDGEGGAAPEREKKAFNLGYVLTEADNHAMAISMSGFLLALGIVAYEALQSLRSTEPICIAVLLVWSSIGVVQLLIARVFNDFFIISHLANRNSIVEDHNIAVACVEAASFVAAGLVSGASISGPSIGFEQFGDQIGSTVLYFFSGQICIILFTCLYEKITGFSVKDELTQNNGAAGVAFGLAIVAIAIVVAAPIRKTDSVLTFWVWFVLGSILLVFVRVLIDKVILPGESLDDEIQRKQHNSTHGNWGAAVVEGGILVVAALMVGVLLPDVCPT